MRSFYEFFAGGGMARAGLGPGWTCLFANDFDLKKSAAYRRNWGARELRTADIRLLTTAQLPHERANLAWASFPCQDLSLAGAGAGLNGARSGAFHPFWALMNALIAESRGPDVIALENVTGALTSHGGRDFAAICSRFHEAGYAYGALVVDAALFLPQSRPRLFVVGARKSLRIPRKLRANAPSPLWHPRALQEAFDTLPEGVKDSWIWWRMAAPALRNIGLAELIEDEPSSVAWRTEEETRRLLALMSEVNLAKVESAKSTGQRMVGCIYRRTRYDESGAKIQRAEVRFDDMSGCLRTPAGGSSRQLLLIVEGESVKSRLISARETAWLMGLPDHYELPKNYNEAYHLTGDGVAVPVVRHIAEQILEPLLAQLGSAAQAAA
ncbi:DNA cytosine methyltransferase [Methylocapsa acidiphila]|uniref:DNA cytosine methyltransferase n=1 Tax=Methylocapsa acidiphila TaxID=133552 RepID=UPI00041C0B0D|nr:DNA cytosine methyltransferase [Methylocapsa acidiphila]